MNLVLGVVIAVVATAITVSAMLLVRRRAPEGSYFTDGDRASGVFGVLATGFSVLLGFIIFLGFSSYDESRSGAEQEATIVAQQVQTAQFMPGESAAELTGELSCYARSVAGTEWEAMGEGRLGDDVNPWGVADVQDHPSRWIRERRRSSPPTTGGWTRPSTASRRGSIGCTARRESCRYRSG